MFGAKYTRMKFWIISCIAFFIATIIFGFAGAMGGETLPSVIVWMLYMFLASTLANRIRDYGSNPWLSLWSIIPFVGLFQALYYGFKKCKDISDSDM